MTHPVYSLKLHTVGLLFMKDFFGGKAGGFFALLFNIKNFFSSDCPFF